MRKEAMVLWDPGSTLSFITFDLARSLDLKDQPVELEIFTVGGEKKVISSQKYTVVFFYSNSQEVAMEVFGIDQISTGIEKVSIDGMVQLFSNEDAKKAKRPASGVIGLLIGFSYAAYHPVKIEEVGHLLLMKNRFEIIVAGTHPEIQETTRTLVKHVIGLHVAANIEEFHNIESLGVTCHPKCGGCRCGKCHTCGKDMTLVEEREHELIKEGLEFNTQSGRWLAHYPWIKDPSCLPDNRSFAYAVLKSTEKRLQKNPLHAETYQKQMDDMLERKAARPIYDRELKSYPGPKFYIAHHDVLSPHSMSTPMRVVFNSSARVKGGPSLNEYLAKGPCLLNQLLGILLRFRQDRFAFIGDIKKMFHSIDISKRDQMSHLYLWRNLDTDERPSTYAMTAVNMGIVLHLPLLRQL